MGKYFVSPSLVEDHEYVVQVEITPDVKKLLSSARAAFAAAKISCPSLESMGVVLPKGTVNLKACDPAEFGLEPVLDGDPVPEIREVGVVFDGDEAVASAVAVCLAETFFVAVVTPKGGLAETEPIAMEKVCGPVPPPAKEPAAVDKGFVYAIDGAQELSNLGGIFRDWMRKKQPGIDSPSRKAEEWPAIAGAANKAFEERDFTNPEVSAFMEENAMLIHSAMESLDGDGHGSKRLARLVCGCDAEIDVLREMADKRYPLDPDDVLPFVHGRQRIWWENFLLGLHESDKRMLREASGMVSADV
jgi:hypothetical protein